MANDHQVWSRRPANGDHWGRTLQVVRPRRSTAPTARRTGFGLAAVVGLMAVPYVAGGDESDKAPTAVPLSAIRRPRRFHPLHPLG